MIPLENSNTLFIKHSSGLWDFYSVVFVQMTVDLLEMCISNSSDLWRIESIVFVQVTVDLLEMCISNSSDLWGIFQPYAHLSSSRKRVKEGVEM